METIQTLVQLGQYILENDSKLNHVITKTNQHNKWFSEGNVRRALNSIAREFLNEEKLNDFVSQYKKSSSTTKVVGIVAAGNIPLVGFHDLLCVLLSNHKIKLKLSDKDKILLPFLIQQLTFIDPSIEERIETVDRLMDFDAVIATGSNNTARYFQHYFGKYPSVIRKNRNSIAILDGSESKEDLEKLGDDIFAYFGLGCRNVSKIYVPEGYDFQLLKDALEPYKTVRDHYHYQNNLDYNRTLLMMNKVPFLNIDFVNFVEEKSIASPISNVHYEFYSDILNVQSELEELAENIQCVVGNQKMIKTIPFGEAQQPTLNDFADNVDTFKFLLEL